MSPMALEAGAFDITTALSTGTQLIKWVFGEIADNPILTAVFVCLTLIPAGIGIFRHLKNAV